MPATRQPAEMVAWVLMEEVGGPPEVEGLADLEDSGEWGKDSQLRVAVLEETQD